MEVVHNLEHTLEETLEYTRKRRLEIVWFEGELTQSERQGLGEDFVVQGVSVDADGSCSWGIICRETRRNRNLKRKLNRKVS